MLISIFILVLLSLAAMLSANSASAATVKKILDRPLVLAHYATICEGEFFAAEMLGLFEKNGLDVELIRTSFDRAKEGIVSGKIDVSDGVLQKWLKPIEQGLDIKFTIGLQQGCVSSVVKADSPYRTVKDLKGKTIGVAGAIGDAAMNYMYRVIIKEGLDPVKDFNWIAFDAGSLIAALETGKADAVVGGDANTFAKIKSGEYRYISRLGTDEYFQDETCCLLAFSPKFIEEHRDVALIVTRIMYEASKYMNEHKEEVTRYAFERGYINGTLEDNIAVVQHYNYAPGVKIGIDSFKKSFIDYQNTGIIDKGVSLKTVLDRAFVIFDAPDIQ
jgi:NitT/TauT family transport system substrate-binding protein